MIKTTSRDVGLRRRRAARSAVALAAAVGLSAAGTAAFAADEGDDEERSPEPAVGKVDSHEQQVDDLTTLTPEDLANALVGEDTGITITGASYTGADEAGGLASGFSGVFQVDGGVVLSSGAVAGEESNLYGPNESESWTTSFGTPGDERLDELTAPNTTGDAAVLEVQFVPETDAVDFRYVFGSDEYNEYVDTEFHDVFAFFVNDQNCALIDGDPVTVNTINNDVNSDLYVDNDLAAGRSHHTELDGFTVPLTCSAEVTADEENTLVLAIADTSDTAFDSTVLIEGGSLRSNNPPVADDQDVETEVDTAVDITLTATDPDGDELTFAIDGDPANGTLEGDAPDVTYVPEEGFTGTDEFTFTASDGSLTSNVATVTVTVAEPEPTPTPTPEPTEEPTPDPTPEPTEEPTPDPTDDPDDDEELPDTGAGMSTLFGAGAVLVAAGLGALLMTRRRLTGQDV